MNRTQLFNWLTECDLTLTNGHYNEAYHGFTWVLKSLDGQTNLGMITMTNEKIEHEMPNIASDLYFLVHDFMDRRYPGWFNGRRTFTEMTDKL